MWSKACVRTSRTSESFVGTSGVNQIHAEAHEDAALDLLEIVLNLWDRGGLAKLLRHSRTTPEFTRHPRTGKWETATSRLVLVSARCHWFFCFTFFSFPQQDIHFEIRKQPYRTFKRRTFVAAEGVSFESQHEKERVHPVSFGVTDEHSPGVCPKFQFQQYETEARSVTPDVIVGSSLLHQSVYLDFAVRLQRGVLTVDPHE